MLNVLWPLYVVPGFFCGIGMAIASCCDSLPTCGPTRCKLEYMVDAVTAYTIGQLCWPVLLLSLLTREMTRREVRP